jgi:hypothetical protein
MEKFDVLFNFSSWEVLKLKIKDIEELISMFSFEKPNRWFYKLQMVNEWVL